MNRAVADTMEQPPPPPRRERARSSVIAQGLSSVWLTGSAMIVALLMILGLITTVLVLGGRTFWPGPLVAVQTSDGKRYLGEVMETNTYRPDTDLFDKLPPGARENARREVEENNGTARRRRFRTGNYRETGYAFKWVSDFEIVEEARPEWALVIERETWGNAYGVPVAFKVRPESEPGKGPANFETVATDPASVWAEFEKHHAAVRARFHERVALEKDEIGRLNRRENNALLDIKRQQLRGDDSESIAKARENYARVQREVKEETARLNERIRRLNEQNDRYRLVVALSDGREVELRLDEVVRAYPANQLSTSRWGEFLTANPREANTEGGVLPAIWGTVAMTLIMSLLVVPFGVLAALYLREYARPGLIVSTVRIAINNLAGVPSIVFGVFGLGFFCYFVGGFIDDTFYPEYAPNPTFGTGGLFWASLTLALLTLPVVIVATEEALASVPNSMREGSYACGASKWQTIWRIVLPRAMPGIMTGMILAMARGAGEVAPLMMVGAVKLAPELPVDGEPPFVHPSRSFMHLGFHIYDVGFQSRDSEAARPMVFTTALLLIALVALLNLTAMWLRSRLRCQPVLIGVTSWTRLLLNPKPSSPPPRRSPCRNPT
jgi:phosphate transport system permease protein